MSLEHWAWLGIAAQPGNKIVDDILRVFPDPEEFFLSGDSGIEKVGTINSKDALRIRATSLDVAKRAVETAENYGAKVLTKECTLPERMNWKSTLRNVLLKYLLITHKYLIGLTETTIKFV